MMEPRLEQGGGANEAHFRDEWRQWASCGSFAPPPMLFLPVQEKGRTGDTQDLLGRDASALIDVLRPENKITSNYGCLGNTVAVHGDAPWHPYICTHCFCTCQEIVLHPRRPPG